MKKWMTLFTLILGGISLQLNAATLTFNKEVGPLVLNGEEVATDIFSSPDKLTLRSGQNQVLFALGQVVVEDGRRTKFNSVPFIIRFEASRDDLMLTYQPFRTMDEARKFEKDPRFNLVTASGHAIPYQLEPLHVNGMQGMQNFEKAVRKYNQQGAGVAVIAVNSENTSVSHVAPTTTQIKSTKTTSSKRAILEAGFNEMTADEQQAFMMWAMKNLKNPS
ncbi:hypothetical protein A3K86_12960 [Photobacterium jeanii]|uniref:UPF0319 protein A3K86_12960 n=1 Tax=Photobacterium jeanii TaxID=858640 RepID=A0A178KBB8_9GAMM|nr:DUF2057 domain-containing protein [Photobacterium jeanii]OAN13933.1 hypothetical protein A3K86_12960 [Photobacterium jeanii]PST89918.1 DUF2057 domain-containing protein [Photobacterium jeanii]